MKWNSAIRNTALVVGTMAVGGTIFGLLLTSLQADAAKKVSTSASAPAASAAIAADAAPRPVFTVLSLFAGNNHDEAVARVGIKAVVESCPKEARYVAAAGSGSYVLGPTNGGPVKVERLVCIPGSPLDTPEQLRAPDSHLYSIDGRTLEASDMASDGVAFRTTEATWVFTATSARVSGRGTVALQIAHTKGVWTLQIPGLGKGSSVAAFLPSAEIKSWTSIFPSTSTDDIEIEDGTAPEPGASAPKAASSPKSTSSEYTPL